MLSFRVKIVFVLVFILGFVFGLVSSPALADQILENRCFDVNKKGNLEKQDGVGCNLDIYSFTEGGSTGLVAASPSSQPFAISIKRKNPTDFQVYEIWHDPKEQSDNSKMAVTSTYVKEGKVSDQTVCTREISPAFAVFANDRLTCVTVDKSFCSHFYQASKSTLSKDKDLDLDAVKKCQTVIPRQISAMQAAMNKSFRNKEYVDLAVDRYKDIKSSTEPFVSSKFMSKVRLNFNESNESFSMAQFKFSGVDSGYVWIQTMFDKCMKFFPPANEATGHQSAPPSSAGTRPATGAR